MDTVGKNTPEIRKGRLQGEKGQRGFFLLSRSAGRLLLGFVLSQFLMEETFAKASPAGNDVLVHAEILSDIVLIDLVFQDQRPFAEGLQCNQQDQ